MPDWFWFVILLAAIWGAHPVLISPRMRREWLRERRKARELRAALDPKTEATQRTRQARRAVEQYYVLAATYGELGEHELAKQFREWGDLFKLQLEADEGRVSDKDLEPVARLDPMNPKHVHPLRHGLSDADQDEIFRQIRVFQETRAPLPAELASKLARSLGMPLDDLELKPVAGSPDTVEISVRQSPACSLCGGREHQLDSRGVCHGCRAIRARADAFKACPVCGGLGYKRLDGKEFRVAACERCLPDA